MPREVGSVGSKWPRGTQLQEGRARSWALGFSLGAPAQVPQLDSPQTDSGPLPHLYPGGACPSPVGTSSDQVASSQRRRPVSSPCAATTSWASKVTRASLCPLLQPLVHAQDPDSSLGVYAGSVGTPQEHRDPYTATVSAGCAAKHPEEREVPHHGLLRAHHYDPLLVPPPEAPSATPLGLTH